MRSIGENSQHYQKSREQTVNKQECKGVALIQLKVIPL